MRAYARAQNRAGKIKEGIRLNVFFFFFLVGKVFFLYIVNFFIFGTLLSCFLRAEREALAGPSLPNDAFVGTSAPCSKAELQPADPAIYNLTMSSCN